MASEEEAKEAVDHIFTGQGTGDNNVAGGDFMIDIMVTGRRRLRSLEIRWAP
jgi:hypothetical protein